jgi:hypothetical protein
VDANRRTAEQNTEEAERDPWETAQEGLELVVLDPAACRLHGDGRGRLWGTVHGREYPELVVHMPFPLSAPHAWVSLVAVEDPDSDGRRSDGGKPDRVELGVLPGLDGCDPETREAIQGALRLRYFLPRVLRIVSVQEEDPGQSGAVVWRLLTDRGPMLLRMPSLFEGIQQLETGRILLSDRDGNRADIPDLSALDPDSRRLLERYYWF